MLASTDHFTAWADNCAIVDGGAYWFLNLTERLAWERRRNAEEQRLDSATARPTIGGAKSLLMRKAALASWVAKDLPAHFLAGLAPWAGEPGGTVRGCDVTVLSRLRLGDRVTECASSVALWGGD